MIEGTIENIPVAFFVTLGWIYLITFILDLIGIHWGKKILIFLGVLLVSFILLALIFSGGAFLYYGLYFGTLFNPLIVLGIFMGILFFFKTISKSSRGGIIKIILILPALFLISLNLAIPNLQVTACQFKLKNLELTTFPLLFPAETYGTKTECAMSIAEASQNEKKCDLIPKTYYSFEKLCYPEDSMPPTCYYRPDERDLCYEDVAKIKKDISVCENAPEDINKDRCYQVIFEQSKDIAICPKMEDPYNKDFCFIDVAKDQKNSEICKQVVYKKDRCYSRIAEINNDVSLCDNVSVSEKGNCYYDVATFTKDSSICDLILSAALKQECYSDVYWAQQGSIVNRKTL